MEDKWPEAIRRCEQQVSALNSTIIGITSRLRFIDKAWGVSSSEHQADLILLPRRLQDVVKSTRNAGTTDLQTLEEASSLLSSNLKLLDIDKQEVASLSDEATNCLHKCAQLTQELSSLSSKLHDEIHTHNKSIKDTEAQLKAVQDRLQSIGAQISRARTEKIADEKEFSRWRTAHNITKWIPGVNILTYPITKVGTLVYEVTLEELEDMLVVLQQDQTNRQKEIQTIRSKLASGTKLLQTVGTLLERAKKVELQGKEIQFHATRQRHNAWQIRPKFDAWGNELHVAVQDLKAAENALIDRMLELGEERRIPGAWVEELGDL